MFSSIPGDDDRDVERRGHTYLTRRDFMLFMAIAVVLVALAYILFIVPGLRNRHFVVSKSNLEKMARGLKMYADANNGGLPPVHQIGTLDAKGRPSTWANQIFDYTGRLDIYNNRANPDEGNTMLTRTTTDGVQTDVELSYGMLTSADTGRFYEIRDQTIILAETLGNGALGSYNPEPLGGPDGFMIGYDNTNAFADSQTKFVTRLAFKKGGDAPLGLEPIHPKGVVGIRADGSIVTFSTAAEAFPVSKTGRNPSGHWVPY